VSGYLCICHICGREERTGPNPLKDGWPICCSQTMTLEETHRFSADITAQMDEIFAPVTSIRAMIDGE